MRILICSNLYPPEVIGGAELIAHYQASQMKAAGHDVWAFAGSTRIGAGRYCVIRESLDGIQIARIRLTYEDFQRELADFRHPAVEAAFDRFLDEARPDVVHFHNLAGMSVGLIFLAKRKGSRAVVTLHDHWAFCHRNTLLNTRNEVCGDFSRCAECLPVIGDRECGDIPIRLRNDFVRLNLDEADALVFPSSYLAESYARAGFRREQMRVIWNGIDIGKLGRISKRRGRGQIRFTYLGHLGQHKGVQILMDAITLLSNRKDFRVNVVGQGEMMPELKRQAASLHDPAQVRFLGFVPNDRIGRVLAETDVHVLPSIWPENQPVSITEAMATRTPSLASRIGGIPELILDGQTGFLFAPGDAHACAARMRVFLDDPGLARSMGDNAYQRIKEASFEVQARRIAELYQEIR